MSSGLCVAAILRDEERFIDEWLAYHRSVIGVDHFFLYDNSDELQLKKIVAPYEDFVSVVEWPGDQAQRPGINRQTKAYEHALEQMRGRFQWASFIDIDEFIVLRGHQSMKEFLKGFEEFGSLCLNWHIFGHNGHFNDPNLVTSSLTRRMRDPGVNVKSITLVDAIDFIPSAHKCKLKDGYRKVDANKKFFTDDLYPGKSDLAHINHYMCRSFKTWMGRVARGDVSLKRESAAPENQWRFDEESTLKYFVESITRNKNEHVDDFMLKYQNQILENMRPTRPKPLSV